MSAPPTKLYHATDSTEGVLYFYLESLPDRCHLMISRDGQMRVTVTLSTAQRRELAKLLARGDVAQQPIASEEVVV